MDMQFLGTLWFLIVGLALFVFTVLDGFDLGIGMLLPFYTKRPEHRVMAIGSIWPVWDGNELWGLTAGGALFAIFPAVFGVILSGFYPFVILLLVSLMYRPISFELWFHNEKSRRFWQTVFALCSFGITFLAGVVVGNTMHGIPFDAAAHGGATFTGSLLSVLNPFSLLTGLLVVSACLVHGSAWLLIKLEGEAQPEARATLKNTWIIHAVVVALWAVVFFATLPGAVSSPLVWILAVLLVADLVVMRLLAGRSFEKLVFLFSTLGLGFVWAIVGAYQFPNLVRNSADPARNLDILNSGSVPSTLQFLGIIGPIALVIVAAYSIVVYRVFKGKMKSQGAHY